MRSAIVRVVPAAMVLALGLLLAGSARAEQQVGPPYAQDRRLQAPVTLYRGRILLGDLLQVLADQTGAPIGPAPADPALGTVELTIGVTGVPAWKVMDALVSLHKASGAEWSWQGDGTPRSPFSLRCAKPLSELAGRAREALKQAVREHVVLSLQGASLPPGERAQFIQQHPELARRLENERAILGIKTFGSLPRDTQERVLAGGAVHLPFADLPPHGQELVRQRMQAMASLNPGRPEFLVDPDEVVVFSMKAPGALTPMILINAGRAGAHNYFGGRDFEAAVRARDDEAWYADAASREVPPAPARSAGGPEEVKRLAAATPDRYLKWLSRTYAVDLLSDVSWRRDAQMSNHLPARATLKQHLEGLASVWPLRLKQRNGLVLLRDRGWFLNEGYGRVPYPLVTDLRRKLGVRELRAADAFSALSPLGSFDEAQLRLLQRDFPVAELVERARPALVAYSLESSRNRKRLLTPEGLPVRELSPRTRRALAAPTIGGPWKGQFLAQGPHATMRLEFSVASDRAALGYVIAAGTLMERRVPLLLVRKPGTPLLVAPAETDALDP